MHGFIGFFEKCRTFLKKLSLNTDFRYSGSLHCIDRVCQNCCIMDYCRNNLFGCNVDHGFCFYINGFCIDFILDLCSGFQLCSGKYMEFLKQVYCLFCGQCRNCIYHGWKVRKSSAFCFFCPFRSITVAVKHNTLMINSIFFDQIMNCHIKVFCLFQTVTGFFECLCCDGVQHYVTFRDRIPGTNHTEFKFISCKCKW